MISRLDFPHLIFYLRLAFLAPIGYPVICTYPPADICEQGEKNLPLLSAEVRGKGTRVEALQPRSKGFSLTSWKPCVSVPRWRQGFFFFGMKM